MNYPEQRREIMGRVRRVVVKVGSAVLTRDGHLDRAVVADLAAQLTWLHNRGLDVVLVSSGAVAAGRGLIQEQALGRLNLLPTKQAAAAIGQSRLMDAYDQAFGAENIVTAQVLLTREDLNSRQRFLNARNTMTTLLKWRVIPIINENDTVAVQELNFGDNDQLGSLVLNLVGADLYINLTSAARVYRRKPEHGAEPEYFDCIDNISDLNIEAICGAKTEAGTGGMYSKLISARRAAQLGMPTLILPGREKEVLRRSFEEDHLGTWVQPEEKKIASRKYWLAYNGEPAGEVRIDRGALKAILEGGRSLLPAGITAVRGNFGRGALVRVLGPEGQLAALGLVSYSAVDLRRIAGRRNAEIEAVLGYVCDEAMHRDNLLPYPAVTV